jgi:hypothetical protein
MESYLEINDICALMFEESYFESFQGWKTRKKISVHSPVPQKIVNSINFYNLYILIMK